MVCFAEVTHFDTVVAFVLPDQEFLFQRIQMFRHKDELLSGRILAFIVLHGQTFFYPSVSTFIIASVPIRSENNVKYLTNAYRVLLTRARQGFIIYIPEGVTDDATRLPAFYDETFNYLKEIGIQEI